MRGSLASAVAARAARGRVAVAIAPTLGLAGLLASDLGPLEALSETARLFATAAAVVVIGSVVGLGSSRARRVDRWRERVQDTMSGLAPPLLALLWSPAPPVWCAPLLVVAARGFTLAGAVRTWVTAEARARDLDATVALGAFGLLERWRRARSGLAPLLLGAACSATVTTLLVDALAPPAGGGGVSRALVAGSPGAWLAVAALVLGFAAATAAPGRSPLRGGAGTPSRRTL